MNEWVFFIAFAWLFVMFLKSRIEIAHLKEEVKRYDELHKEQIIKQVKDFQGG